MSATAAPRRSPNAGAARIRPSSRRPPASGRHRARRARTPRSGGGTSPAAMRCANPSTTAVLPTPASPVRIGLFWRRRISTSMICRISSSRPRIGSISPDFGLGGQILRKAIERRRALRRRRLARRPGVPAATQAGAVHRTQIFFLGAGPDLAMFVGERGRRRSWRIPSR